MVKPLLLLMILTQLEILYQKLITQCILIKELNGKENLHY